MRAWRSAFFFLVGFWLGAIPVLAFADTYIAQQRYTHSLLSGFSSYVLDEARVALCTDVRLATWGGASERWQVAGVIMPTTVAVGSSATKCETADASSWIQFGSLSVTLECPWGGALSGGMCEGAPACEYGYERNGSTGVCEAICPAGSTWNGTTCENPCQAKVGNSYGTTSNWAALNVETMGSGGTAFCNAGCVVKGTKTECSTASGENSAGDYVTIGQNCMVQGPFSYTGSTCQEGTMPTLEEIETAERPWWESGKELKDCAASGGSWGEVNGQQVCVGLPGSGSTTTKTESAPTTTTTTNPDGTKTETTTTSTTECAGGTCTTTTGTTVRTIGGDGQQIGETEVTTGEKTEGQSEFCDKNPQDTACVGTETGGSFKGDCSAGFKCTGDAVECATAKVLHAQNCALQVAKDVTDEFATIKAFVGTGQGEGLDRKEITPESLAPSIAGGGAGLADRTFSVQGRDITIPLSTLNQYLEMLGFAVMAISWLMAARIVGGAI